MAQPEKTFRIGSISASIFRNTVEGESGSDRSFRSVTLQRRYRDGDEWKYTYSLNFADIANAREVLRLALDHIAQLEAATDAGGA